MTTSIVAIAIAILIRVEPMGNHTGDNGASVGPLQTQVRMMQECNRLIDVQHLKHRKFVDADRYTYKGSYEMAMIFLPWAQKHYHITSPQRLAYRWNKPAHGKVTLKYKRAVERGYRAYLNQWGANDHKRNSDVVCRPAAVGTAGKCHGQNPNRAAVAPDQYPQSARRR